MEVESNFKKPVIYNESPAFAALSINRSSINQMQSTVVVKNSSANGSKQSPPPKVKLPPPICLRDKSKWNLVSSECTRKLNAFLIKSNIPFHTFALEEERKVKAVIKGIPLEFEISNIIDDPISQGYPVHAVHRMRRRNGSALSMVLVVLEMNDLAIERFKNFCRTDRIGASKGGTVLYDYRSLYCCPIDIPPLVNIEATACRLSMTGHGVLLLVSVYLLPKKKLLRSDIEALFALGDAVILFGDFNRKNTNWKCNYSNINGRKNGGDRRGPPFQYHYSSHSDLLP
ncbi:hypothetical protein EVAR_14213_1 [Eumeta japonica]|uniref:RNA-directed DNA polymerase from mobile element jockey n=1 Tax=Eumeta variegata TaxID=151549 RepID=A0A4C1UEW1_EUMVA|nr:hypothetical protein EVAR_14213_1 [Eumeta japonica]